MTRRFILTVALVAAALWGIFVAFRFRSMTSHLRRDYPVWKMCQAPNVHRRLLCGGADRAIYFVLCRDLAPGRLFALAPVKKHFAAVLAARKPGNNKVPPASGCYYGRFKGPSEVRTFFLSLTTGYSVRSLHRVPLGLSSFQGRKLRSFLHSPKDLQHNLLLCGEPFIHDLFPDILCIREYLNNEDTQDEQMVEVIKSRLRKNNNNSTLQMYFLGSLAIKKSSAETEKTMNGVLAPLMKHVNKHGGLVVALSANFDGKLDGVTGHDLLCYGPKVRNKMFKNVDNISLDDVTSTLSFIIGVPQPATCLGMPISNLLVEHFGRRRLTYVRQIEQENYQQLDVLIQKRFTESTRIHRKIVRGLLGAEDKEADFLAQRRERLRRKDVPLLLEKRAREFAQKVEETDNQRIGWSILMGVPIFMLLLIAFLFAPTWWHCLCFGFYLLFFQVIGTAALLELDSSLVWSALEPRGLVTTWANPALLALALTLWCLAGGKFKWNGPSSLKSFYVVSCAVLSIPPLYFYLYFAGSAVQQAQWWMWVGLSCAELSAFVAPIFLVVGMLVTFVSRRGTTVRADGGSS